MNYRTTPEPLDYVRLSLALAFGIGAGIVSGGIILLLCVRAYIKASI